MFQASSFKFYEKGFTLIEAVTSVSVFAIAMTSIIGVFVSVQRLNAESFALQSLQQNARFVTEDISKMIRNGQVDYAGYSGAISQPSTETLRLVDQDGQAVQIYQQGDDLIITRSGAGTSAFTGSEVKILDFKAYVYPSTNPFPGGSEQPTVTVFIDFESSVNTRDIVRIPFQVTAATRQYPE
jgi:type II secretory pathway pseudopilin PulG